MQSWGEFIHKTFTNQAGKMLSCLQCVKIGINVHKRNHEAVILDMLGKALQNRVVEHSSLRYSVGIGLGSTPVAWIRTLAKRKVSR